MHSQETEKILKKYQLRSTSCRVAIIDLFYTQPHALSHTDIETYISDNFDRVTIYRTLKTFQEKGLIHKVLDDVASPKYALCKTECEVNHHHHSHLHFKCFVCGQTNCLNEVEIPAIQLPKGYLLEEAYCLMSGVCQKCNV